MSSRTPLLLATVMLILTMASCVKDPVTGRSTLNFMSESQEIQMGASTHEAVVQSMGLYDDESWRKYINGIGQEIANVSQRSNLEYTFNVVDSPVVNAFALPGGWVYFTRGILAHFNSEDELAGVMGHEVGHVVARHSAEQYSRQQLATIGLGVAVVLSDEFRPYAGYAQMGLGLVFLKFSRNQESESDLLGVQYTAALGYDSHQMAGFFRTIARLSDQGGQSVPNFLSTHPNPLNRESRVNELAEKYLAESTAKPRNLDANTYLRRLEGMVYGEDPRNGYFDETSNTFFHPRWEIQFPAPAGWKLQRNALQLQFSAPENDAAMMIMRDPKETQFQTAADNFTKIEGLQVLDRRNISANGLSGIRMLSKIASEQQTLRVVSYFYGKGDQVFVGHGFAEDSKFDSKLALLDGSLRKFQRLTNAAAKSKKPVRLRIKPAPRSDSLEANLKALGSKQEDLEALALLNGLLLSDSVKAGRLLKTLGN